MTNQGSRIAGLDVLRGVAIGLVMLRHALPDLFPGAGVVGVVMFFTLSGYLITGVLLDEFEDHGRVRLGRFYFRRALRLVPALLVLVVVLTIVTVVFDPLGDRHRLLATIVVAATWTGDLPWLHTSAATYHLWTLAVEEQFYLLWPGLLVAHLARRRGATAFVLAGLTCTVACVLTVVWFRTSPDLAYALPTSWAGCFVVGAATRRWQHRFPAPSPAFVLASFAALGCLSMVALRGHSWTYLGGGPVISAFTSVLLVTVGMQRRFPGPWVQPLAALGVVSYAAYLWNYPLTLWLRPEMGLWAAPIGVALTLVVAALSWRLVELPVQTWARRRARERDVLAGAPS